MRRLKDEFHQRLMEELTTKEEENIKKEWSYLRKCKIPNLTAEEKEQAQNRAWSQLLYTFYMNKGRGLMDSDFVD